MWVQPTWLLEHQKTATCRIFRFAISGESTPVPNRLWLDASRCQKTGNRPDRRIQLRFSAGMRIGQPSLERMDAFMHRCLPSRPMVGLWRVRLGGCRDHWNSSPPNACTKRPQGIVTAGGRTTLSWGPALLLPFSRIPPTPPKQRNETRSPWLFWIVLARPTSVPSLSFGKRSRGAGA